MRYSRMLEESSFANRKADYFWLLFLSSLMLLVRLPLPHPFMCNISFILSPGPIPAIQPPLSLLPTRLRAHILLVAPAPLDAHLAIWSAHHHRAVPSLCTRRLFVGAHGHVARGGKRSRWMCGGPRWVVHP
jgi:hypothetical protein